MHQKSAFYCLKLLNLLGNTDKKYIFIAKIVAFKPSFIAVTTKHENSHLIAKLFVIKWYDRKRFLAYAASIVIALVSGTLI
ncbi:hypothetical protein MOTT16_00165 [Moraxella osloensis]|uniref:Uncharacterized protein n=1 Tax=Faucicola osloensis TaxID=34062 RepID=A0A1B8PQ90_FAUOS|nr:hypothetical protein YHS_00165 [Moraxella osloensis]ATW84885.1 hypothetical protein MOTT16_00165 [Moraxella osloensis]OBX56631.1 hypothetical protein A9Z61_11355 [Moraxella osloensis]